MSCLKLNWMNLCNLIRENVQIVLAIYGKIKTKNPLIIFERRYIIKSVENKNVKFVFNWRRYNEDIADNCEWFAFI